MIKLSTVLEPIFERKIDFVIDINNSPKEKLDELLSIIKISENDIKSKNFVMEVTKKVMKEKSNDSLFLLWMHFIGFHIIRKYKAKWILIKYPGIRKEFYYIPFLVDSSQELWNIGNGCESIYYNKRRMYNISFDVFYKLEVERAINKPNLKDKAYSKRDIFIF